MSHKIFSKKTLKYIAIVFIPIAIIGVIFSGDTNPVIKVDNLSGETINTDSKNYRLNFKNENYVAGQNVKVFINDKDNLFVNHTGNGKYYTDLALKEGSNSVKILVGSYEESAKKFAISLKLPVPEAQVSAPQPAETKKEPSTVPAVDDSIFEAEITCQEHAESYFNVDNINISYDQSSIKRKNPDGTVLIKANIADSQGAFRQQKPLGTMECSTSSDGMRVISFRNY